MRAGYTGGTSSLYSKYCSRSVALSNLDWESFNGRKPLNPTRGSQLYHDGQ